MKAENAHLIELAGRLLDEFADFLLSLPPERRKLRHKIVCDIARRFTDPCSVAVIGMVKAGKSSFVNAFLGKELAVTGTSECTAVLTRFHYGAPPDPARPVLCEWRSNESSEWRGLDFLASLQGRTKEIIDRAHLVKSATHYVHNESLRQIDLIDTPGFGSTIDTHENVAREVLDAYRFLRDAHDDDTHTAATNADAVLLLVDGQDLATSYDAVKNFISDGNLHVYNIICVVTKIDNMEDYQRDNFVSGVERELDRIGLKMKVDVVPVSSAVQIMIQKYGEDGLRELQEKLRRGFPNRDNFMKAVSSEEKYERKAGKGNPLGTFSVEDWRSFYNGFEWQAFKTVATILYMNNDFDDAFNKIKKIGGFEFCREDGGRDGVREKLHRHFFNCSRLLKCRKSLEETHEICKSLLLELEDLQDTLFEISTFIKYIKGHPAYSDSGVGGRLLDFVESSGGKDRVKEIEEKTYIFNRRFETIVKKVHDAYRCYDGLVALENTAEVFAQRNLSQERDELQALFRDTEKFRDKGYDYIVKRWRYWNEIGSDNSNQQMRYLGTLASKVYGALLSKED